jgi:type II secretory pathway pseudopilin PulG
MIALYALLPVFGTLTLIGLWSFVSRSAERRRNAMQALGRSIRQARRTRRAGGVDPKLFKSSTTHRVHAA